MTDAKLWMKHDQTLSRYHGDGRHRWASPCAGGAPQPKWGKLGMNMEMGEFQINDGVDGGL